MALFGKIYNCMLRWAKSPKAPWYLGGLSFAESSFFPLPPDLMLAPMCLARPKLAWRYALLTTLTSVAGGLLGYAMGYYAFEMVEQFMLANGYESAYQRAQLWFTEWGFWAIFLAGFSPIPYKIFTITAGSFAMALLPFFLASLIGRGMRFYLVAGLIFWGGERIEKVLQQYVERIGWGVVIIIVVLYGVFI